MVHRPALPPAAALFLLHHTISIFFSPSKSNSLSKALISHHHVWYVSIQVLPTAAISLEAPLHGLCTWSAQDLTSSEDPEGDSQMNESPSSHGDDSDAMFPAANDAPGASSLNQHATPYDQQTAELSPPYSQDLPEANGDEAMDITWSELGPVWGASQNTTDGNGRKSDFARSAETATAFQPGASWDNPKARDEWKRQWSGILDKKFSLGECFSFKPSTKY